MAAGPWTPVEARRAWGPDSMFLLQGRLVLGAPFPGGGEWERRSYPCKSSKLAKSGQAGEPSELEERSPAALQDTLSLAVSRAWPVATASTSGLLLASHHFGAGVMGFANEM